MFAHSLFQAVMKSLIVSRIRVLPFVYNMFVLKAYRTSFLECRTLRSGHWISMLRV